MPTKTLRDANGFSFAAASQLHGLVVSLAEQVGVFDVDADAVYVPVGLYSRKWPVS